MYMYLCVQYHKLVQNQTQVQLFEKYMYPIPLHTDMFKYLYMNCTCCHTSQLKYPSKYIMYEDVSRVLLGIKTHFEYITSNNVQGYTGMYMEMFKLYSA